MSIVIYDPIGEVRHEDNELTRRPTSLDGLRIGVLDNSKANARRLLIAIAEALAETDGASYSHLIRKKTASRPCDPADLADLIASSDIVLTGTADCGSCTTWSVNDVATLEAAGIPTVLIASTAFADLARSVGETLGYATLPLAVTEHPIGGIEANELEEKSRLLLDDVRSNLLAVIPTAEIRSSDG